MIFEFVVVFHVLYTAHSWCILKRFGLWRRCFVFIYTYIYIYICIFWMYVTYLQRTQPMLYFGFSLWARNTWEKDIFEPKIVTPWLVRLNVFPVGRAPMLVHMNLSWSFQVVLVFNFPPNLYSVWRVSVAKFRLTCTKSCFGLRIECIKVFRVAAKMLSPLFGWDQSSGGPYTSS